MKKSICLFLFLSVFCFSCLATELWNGFNSGMSYSEVKKLIFSKVAINKIEEKRKSDMDSGYVKYDRPYTECLEIYTTSSDYFHPKFGGEIIFYFAFDELYHVKVAPNLDGDTILTRLKQKYGEPQKVEKIKKDITSLYETINLIPPGYWYEHFWEKNGISIRFTPYDRDGIEIANHINYIDYSDPNYKKDFDNGLDWKKEEIQKQKEKNKQKTAPTSSKQFSFRLDGNAHIVSRDDLIRLRKMAKTKCPRVSASELDQIWDEIRKASGNNDLLLHEKMKTEFANKIIIIYGNVARVRRSFYDEYIVELKTDGLFSKFGVVYPKKISQVMINELKTLKEGDYFEAIAVTRITSDFVDIPVWDSSGTYRTEP